MTLHNLCPHMHVNKTEFERNSSLEYYHMTCIGKTKTYKLKSSIGFRNTYPLDSDLSSGYRYPAFEQPGPDLHRYLVQARIHTSFHCFAKICQIFYNRYILNK